MSLLNDLYGDAFATLAPLLALHQRLQVAGIEPYGASIAWIFPTEFMPGVTSAYGIPIERASISAPALTLRPRDA